MWGPKGTAKRLAKAYDLPRKPGMREEFSFRVYAKPIALGPFTIEPFEVDHPVPAYGLRVSAFGKVLAYSGDTGPTDALFESRRRRRPVPVRGVLPRVRRQPAEPAPDGQGGRRDRDPGPREAARRHPRAALARRAGDPRRGQGRLRRPVAAWPRRATSTSL
ncbi:hypothetical protein [Nocardioides convexus]|uniref:hypothetical protein n=1 Tax=Nocardioides convexus TaxID=2712224 RepID=UPI0024185441|nr:hypothetical protein [Nocardioides convexus]